MRTERKSDGQSDAPPPAPAVEAALVAGELAEAYREAVAFFHERMGYPIPEAIRLARQEGEGEDLGDRLLRAPPQEVAWHALAAVGERAPGLLPAIWERLLEAARAELASGRRAALPFHEGGTPFARAQFLALRQAFRDAWAPQGGIEDALVDALAQAQTSYLVWLARLHAAGLAPGGDEETARHIQQAGAMVDRFNRIFVRTLRALRELRQRPAPAVAIGAAGQVNVGAVQRNEAAPAAGARRGRRRRAPRPAESG